MGKIKSIEWLNEDWVGVLIDCGHINSRPLKSLVKQLAKEQGVDTLSRWSVNIGAPFKCYCEEERED